MRGVALCLFAATLGGCSLDPAYHRPAPPVPALWPAANTTSQVHDTVALLPWREVVRDVRLRAVIEQALQQNRDLRIAAANLRAARGKLELQRASALPELDAQAQAIDVQEPVSAVLGGRSTQVVRAHIYALQSSISSYEINLFGEMKSLEKAAKGQWTASQATQLALRSSIVAEACRDWLQLAADRERLQIAKDIATSHAATLRIVRRRVSLGMALATEEPDAAASNSAALANVALLIAKVAEDHDVLDLVIGAPAPDANLPDELPSEPVLLATTAGLKSEALLQRPDVIAAEDRLKADYANIGAARARFFPSIILTTTGGVESAVLQSLFSGSPGAFTFIPSLTAPIFDGGRNRASLRIAVAERDAAAAYYEKTIQTGFREVADALVRSKEASVELEQRRAQSAGVERAKLVVQHQYDRGTAGYLETLSADRISATARQDMLDAVFRLQMSRVDLYAALGGG